MHRHRNISATLVGSDIGTHLLAAVWSSYFFRTKRIFIIQLWGSLVILQNHQNSLGFIYLISIYYTRMKDSNDFKFPKGYFFELIFGECLRLRSSEITARPLPDSRFQIR